MVVNRKPTGRAVSMPVGLAIGEAVALGCTLLGAMLVAKLIDSETLEESAIGYGSVGILLAASFLSALTAYGKIKRQRAVVCMVSGGIYFLSLLGITALFFGGQYSGVGVTAALIAAGSGCAVLLGVGGRKGKGRTHHKIVRR